MCARRDELSPELQIRSSALSNLVMPFPRFVAPISNPPPLAITKVAAASGQPKQAAHARSAKVKPLHATLARRALLRLDSMAAPDPRSLGVPRPEFPRLSPAGLPRYPLQTILR